MQFANNSKGLFSSFQNKIRDGLDCNMSKHSGTHFASLLKNEKQDTYCSEPSRDFSQGQGTKTMCALFGSIANMSNIGAEALGNKKKRFDN